MPASRLIIQTLPDFPDVHPGNHLAAMIVERMSLSGIDFQDHDVLCISSKIVSKAENRFVDLRTIEPSPRAEELAGITHKSSAMVELILQQSTMVSRAAPYVLVVRHRLGFVCANAGIDQSNLGIDNPDIALLLPENPSASAKHIRTYIGDQTGKQVAVVITDTHGRPFRQGNLNIAVGISGVPAVLDERGQPDHYGRTLKNTITAFADQVAAAAGLITGEAAEGQPVVLISGLSWQGFSPGTTDDLVRPVEKDLYLKN